MKARPILMHGRSVRNLLAGPPKRRMYVKAGEDSNSPEHLAKRLANGAVADPDTGCWVWQRHRNNHGYGKLTVDGRGVYAHRLSYELCFGPIPDGSELLHSCDNPGCINPDHLSVGTRSDNMRDCSEKGRARIPATFLPGERNGASKLTASQVARIRRLLATGRTQADIAALFGVSPSQISNIKRGRAWA